MHVVAQLREQLRCFASCGAVVGVTVKIAMSAASFVVGCVHRSDTRLGSQRLADVVSVLRQGVVVPLASRTTSNGPLTPGP